MDGFIPYFNQSKNDRQLYETEVFFNLFRESELVDADFYGAVSWKFGEKTGLTGNDFFQFLNSNPKHDVYLANPYPELIHLYDNPWIQGENVHPGLLKISQTVFDLSKYKVDLNQIRLEKERQLYCNYFAGSGAFWKSYLIFLREIVSIVETNPQIRKHIKKKTSYIYEASFLPFFLERLLPTYLYLNPEIKTISYKYKDEFLLNRYLKVIKEKEDALFRHQRIFRKIPFLSLLRKLVKY